MNNTQRTGKAPDDLKHGGGSYYEHGRRMAAVAKAKRAASERASDDLLAPSTLPPWLRGDTSTLPKAPPSKARKGEK